MSDVERYRIALDLAVTAASLVGGAFDALAKQMAEKASKLLSEIDQ